MIKITKEEAQYLRSNGRSGDIHMSSMTKNSRGKRYYLTQSKAAMQLLNSYRKDITSEVYDRRRR